jgi:hypothetical protein
MNVLLRCEKGHRWESPVSSSSAKGYHDLCPVCGDVPLVEAVEAQPSPPARAPGMPAEADAGMSWGGVRLGPSLPMPVYTSLEVWNPDRIGALALYCSDGRWGEAFDDFCHRKLLIPRYDRWAVPGGPAWLAARASDDFAQAAREQLDFLVRVHELERIILITHYGCAYYGEALHQGPEECLPEQMDDVRSAVEALRDWFPDVTAEGYLAMRSGNCLSFHRVEGS